MKYIEADEEQLPRATKCAAGSDGSTLSISTQSSYLLPAKEVACRLCFHRCLSVSQSLHGPGGVPFNHYNLWCVRPHHTVTSSQTRDLTVHGPPGPTSPGHDQTCSTWILLYRNPQTYSNLFIMKHVRFVGRPVASYWNAFLFTHNFESINFTCQIHSVLEEPLSTQGECPTLLNLALKLTCHQKENWKVNFSKMTNALKLQKKLSPIIEN